MKSTGVVRKVDELGRIVIPIELRRTMGMRRKMLLRSTLTMKNHSQEIRTCLYFLWQCRGSSQYKVKTCAELVF